MEGEAGLRVEVWVCFRFYARSYRKGGGEGEGGQASWVCFRFCARSDRKGGGGGEAGVLGLL